MEIKTVSDAFDRVTKKQKLSYTKTHEALDKLSHEIEKALQTIQNGTADNESVITDLKSTFQETAPSYGLETTQKELNAALSKYPKALEKAMNPDISKAYRNNVEFDPNIVNEVIAKFFYRQGMFDVGDSFVSESEGTETSSRKAYVEMYTMLEALKRRDLEPALNWAGLNSDKLKQANSDLEVKLHSLRFLEIAQNETAREALNYAREHITAFTDLSLIQKLMGSLLWSGKLEESPYTEFVSPSLWTNAVNELTKQYCNILGESDKSPLSVTVSAGSQALPPLLKYMSLMVNNKRQDWSTMEQLPVPVELTEEFQFHSVFVCPVSKEQSSEDNPAMRLRCGHVLCKQSINRMSKNGSKSFKCPYCPSDIDVSQCKQLYL
ncbi:unnamed protein product [Cochlearia groenlandica]